MRPAGRAGLQPLAGARLQPGCELSVVVDIAYTETAALAEYVLPAAAQRGEHPALGWTVRAGDPSSVWYTSGTTGDPKGAVTTHSSGVWAATCMTLAMNLNERHRLLGVAPVFHRGRAQKLDDDDGRGD